MSVAAIGAAAVAAGATIYASNKNASAARKAQGMLSTTLPDFTSVGPGGARAGLGIPTFSQDYSFQDLMNNSALGLTADQIANASLGIGQAPTKQVSGSIGSGGTGNQLNLIDLLGAISGNPTLAASAQVDPNIPRFITNPEYTRYQTLQSQPESDANAIRPPQYTVNPAYLAAEQSVLNSLAAENSRVASINASTQFDASTSSFADAQAKPVAKDNTMQAAYIGIPGGDTGFDPTGGQDNFLIKNSLIKDPMLIGGNTPASRNSLEGLFVNGNPNIFGFQLGDLDPSRTGLVNLAQQNIGRAGMTTGLPPEIQQALAGVQAQSGFIDPSSNLLRAQLLTGMQQSGLAAQDLMSARDPYSLASILSGQAGQGAFGAIANASIGGDAARARQLALLRQEAAPEEERQLQNFRENLFATGRGATTGGAQLAEAFAKGLGQADLSRQLVASSEGRAYQGQALQQAQGLTGLFSGTKTLEDSLLQSAFSRFQTTQDQLGGLGNTQFQRGLGINELGYDRASQNLQNVTGLASLPVTLQGAQLSNALSALQGQAGLQSQALEGFNPAIALAQAKANAEIGAGSNLATLTTGTNFGERGQILANLALGIGERFGSGGSNSSSSYLSNAFAPAVNSNSSLGNTSIMTQQPSNPFNLNFNV